MKSPPLSYSRLRALRFSVPITAGFLGLVMAGRAEAANVSDRFYFSADLGPSFVQDTTVKSSDPLVQIGKLGFEPGVRLDVGFGYHITDWLAAEVETGFLFNYTDSIRDEFGGTSDLALFQAPILANLVYHIPTRSRFRPFVGAGVGGVVTRLEDYDLFYGGSDEDSGFAWQGFAGCRYQLSSSVELGLIYRYLGTSEQSFDSFHLRLDRIRSHSVGVSVSLKF